MSAVVETMSSAYAQNEQYQHWHWALAKMVSCVLKGSRSQIQQHSSSNIFQSAVSADDFHTFKTYSIKP